MRITKISRALRLCVLAGLVGAMTVAVVGCSSASKGGVPATPVGAVPVSSAVPSSSAASVTVTKAGARQECATCSFNKMPVLNNGTVESLNGTQIIRVDIKNGTYLPNHFVAKAGVPITVVFTVVGPDAVGCLAKPTFRSLHKFVSVPTGTQSLDLGALAPGRYDFTCSMGMNPGWIVVQ